MLNNNARTQTIMLIEHDVLLRMALSECLRECGYRVIEGIKVEDVWTIIKATVKLDILFARIQRGGLALASKVRKTSRGTNVILSWNIADAVQKYSAMCGGGPLMGLVLSRRIQRLLPGRQRSLKRKGAQKRRWTL